MAGHWSHDYAHLERCEKSQSQKNVIVKEGGKSPSFPGLFLLGFKRFRSIPSVSPMEKSEKEDTIHEMKNSTCNPQRRTRRRLIQSTLFRCESRENEEDRDFPPEEHDDEEESEDSDCKSKKRKRKAQPKTPKKVKFAPLLQLWFSGPVWMLPNSPFDRICCVPHYP